MVLVLYFTVLHLHLPAMTGTVMVDRFVSLLVLSYKCAGHSSIESTLMVQRQLLNVVGNQEYLS
jgi:hypothetical protein